MSATRGFLIVVLLIQGVASAQQHTISTEDITHFWKAYDKLSSAKTKGDSISIMQQHYIDRATDTEMCAE
ncbi:MAG: hypothetical protein KF845_14000 [Cyclobacteriaceae bacterium]|nr:hypothetical protein [Cyclobacteriaceae bacterium]